MKRKTKLLTLGHILRSFRKPSSKSWPKYRHGPGRRPPHYIFHIRRFHPVDRIAWFFIRRVLNRDRFCTRVMRSGPRLPGSASTRKENGIAMRVYIETKPTVMRRERWETDVQRNGAVVRRITGGAS